VKNRCCKIKRLKGGVNICLREKSYKFDNLGPYAKFKNPRTTPAGEEGNFTPKYIIVGAEGGGSPQKLAILLFWYLNPRRTPSGEKAEFETQIYHGGGGGGGG
jgi:hypothetical protein